LPLTTPFRNGALDQASLRHYAALPVNGLTLAATSGERLTLSIAELERIVALARAENTEGMRYRPI
jgi:4-hydroxy-tetrahydrodipicolinate synthase